MKDGGPSPTREAVKRRWNLLQDALFAKRKQRSRRQTLMEECKFFDIFSLYSLSELSCPDFAWFRYEVMIKGVVKTAKIRHSLRTFTVQELAGFNNTGNVRIWPSEEILAFIALKNENFFKGKSVLEVGGGMSCLVGVFLARYIDCERVHVTDGNPIAVENVKEILKENDSKCPISCDLLMWNEYREHSCAYDVIVAADCLFFDEFHTDLIQLMSTLLKPNGTVLIVAPKRAGTLQKFADLGSDFGLRHSIRSNYDETVWSQHIKARERKDYKEDVHYPLLLVMDKLSDSERPVEWPEY